MVYNSRQLFSLAKQSQQLLGFCSADVTLNFDITHRSFNSKLLSTHTDCATWTIKIAGNIVLNRTHLISSSSSNHRCRRSFNDVLKTFIVVRSFEGRTHTVQTSMARPEYIPSVADVAIQCRLYHFMLLVASNYVSVLRRYRELLLLSVRDCTPVSMMDTADIIGTNVFS